jgi:probable rRNA maturation factor
MIVNLQRKVRINARDFAPFVEALSESIEEAHDSKFSVAFISDRRMKELNGFFRGKDSTTDVLSFPHEPDEFESALGPDFSRPDDQPSEVGTKNYLGDIVISVEQAQKQAKENKLTLDNEIKQLILHGLLHLCGYDHETDNGEMNKRELELRKKLKI